jgi:type I restriction enzyme M protein
MRYGWSPAGSKKAELMFAQHMVAVLKQRGVAATVMPHGVLFRGGAEKDIRIKMLKDDVVEAVIGLAPNLFYGAALPACVLLLRSPHGKPSERRGEVLFINADRDFVAGRAQNELAPEHSEKLVATYRGWREIPGYSKIVTVEELLGEEADANLSVRRWVDNSPAPEPQDVKAHLFGGVPLREVEARADLFEAYGVDGLKLFTPRDGDSEYVDFLAEGPRTTAGRIPGLASEREAELWVAYEGWWMAHRNGLAGLAEHKHLNRLRTDLLGTFSKAVLPVGVLDEFAVGGVIAGWWVEQRNDLKALAAGGFERVLDGWVAVIEAGMEPAEGDGAGRARKPTATERRSAMDHPVVRQLIPGFLVQLDLAEQVYAAADLAYREAEASRLPTADDGDEGEVAIEPRRESAPEEEVERLKKTRAAASKKRNDMLKRFLPDLRTARDWALASGETEKHVGAVFEEKLRAELAAVVAGGRRELVARFLGWAEKYEVSLAELEHEGDAAGLEFAGWLKGLGYAG